eukprot:PITA_04583
MILDGAKDHVVCHVASKGTAKEMWDALATLYQGSSKQRKMYLEQKLRSAQMLEGERVDPFLTKLKETRDELAALPNWDEMWAALKQEEPRRDLLKVKLDGSSNNSGLKPKVEEEYNTTLALKGQQGQRRRKKGVSKVKCFRFGKMGHYASQCPLKKKDKDEKHDPKVAATKIE